MTSDDLITVEEEMTRMLRAIREFDKKSDYKRVVGRLPGDRYTAAIRRASMDLTRALADLRRP